METIYTAFVAWIVVLVLYYIFPQFLKNLGDDDLEM